MSRKPRVLIVAPWAPFPLDAGSRRVWTACRSLADRYDFSLLTFFNPGADYAGAGVSADHARGAAVRLLDEARYFKGVFHKVRDVPHAHEPDPSRPDLPDDVRRFHSPRMALALAEVVRRDEIDLVHVEFDLMSPYVETVRELFPGLPCLLTHHDMGSVSLFQSYFREMSGWRRFLRLPEWRRRRSYTRRICARYDGVVVLTEADRRRLARLSPGAAIHVVPTGVDLSHFTRAVPRSQRQPKTLVYVGHYPHYPNEDAALWFGREVMPLLWKRDPAVRFEIVGTGPTEALRSLARRDPRIVVTGAVPDVRDFEERAIAMVAPLRLGQGIKGKILEGMAAGAPVVATPLANEGIRAEPGRQILLASAPRQFVRHVLDVIEDAALWERLSAEGRAFVEKEHSWTARAQLLDGVYRQALKTSQRAPKLSGI